MNFLASWRTVLVLAIAVVAAEPLLFWGTFAGDAQVHLVFMESASQGRFYEFNPGKRYRARRARATCSWARCCSS